MHDMPQPYQSLPLPRAGHIKHIIHVADIHIRPGIENKSDKSSRYTEYSRVFQRILAFVQSFDQNGDTVMCIAGDILHDNKKVGASCIELFYEILGHISACIPIYIICGNHDYNQASIESQDLLSSLAHPLHHANIAYLQETGVYSAANVDFGVLAIQRVLRAGNTHGAVKELPAFPPAPLKAEGKTRVALFHGDVFGQYPIAKIMSAGYDICMLGDLHGQQVYNTSVDKSMQKTFQDSDYAHPQPDVFSFSRHYYTESKSVYAYAGSTLQQNYGEPLLGHGFLLWDLENKTVDTYHVRNDYGFLNVSSQRVSQDAQNTYAPFVELKKPYRYDDPGKSNTCAENQPTRIPLQGIQDYRMVMPSILRVRFKLHEDIAFHDPQFIDNTIAQLRSMGHDIESSDALYLAPKYHEREADSQMSSAASAHRELDDLENVDIKRFNSPDVWCEYLKGRMPRDGEDAAVWQKWVHDPAQLKLRHVFARDATFFDKMLPGTIKKSILDRDAKTEKECEVFRQDLDNVLSQDSHRHVSFEILHMAWSYILCFGPHCFFDFQMLDQKVHCIGGKNGYGKTSFLETICIALFGEGFPSRTSKYYTSAILHENLPKNTRPFTSINIRLNNTDSFNIKRVFCRNSADKNKLSPKEVVISRIDDAHKIITEVHSGMRATQQWIANNVGTMQTFLTSCMISQNNEHDFFDKKPADQKAYLDQQLHFSSTHNFLSTLKSSANAHKDITTRLHDALHLYHDNMQKTAIDEAKLDHLEVTTQEARAHISESEAIVAQNPISLLVQNDFQQVLASVGIPDVSSVGTMPKEQVQATLEQAFEIMSGGCTTPHFDLALCKAKARDVQHDIDSNMQKQAELDHILSQYNICEDAEMLHQKYQNHIAAGETRFSHARDSLADIPRVQEKVNAVQSDIDRLCAGDGDFGGDAEVQKHDLANLEKEWESLEDKRKCAEKNMADDTDVCLSSVEKEIAENQKKMEDILSSQESDSHASSTIDEKMFRALKERLVSFTRDYTGVDTVVEYIEKLEKQCHALQTHLLAPASAPTPTPTIKSALEIEMMREKNKNIVRTCAQALHDDTYHNIASFLKDNDHQGDKTKEETILFCFEHDAFPTYLSEKLEKLEKRAHEKREKQDALAHQSEHHRAYSDAASQKQERSLEIFEMVMQARPAMRIVARKEDPHAIQTTLDELDKDIRAHRLDDAGETARARRFTETYPALESKIKQHCDICSLLEQCEDYPFNPACSACVNHPWKKRRESLLSTKRDLETCLAAAATDHDCTMDDLSKIHSQFSDHLNRAHKSRDDKAQLERRLCEAQEVCEAEERELVWCRQKDTAQEELASSKKASQKAQEEMHKCSLEMDRVTQKLSTLMQSLVFVQTLHTTREEFMARQAEITAWTKWAKKNEKKMAFEKIREAWKEDAAREKEYDEAWYNLEQKKKKAHTVQTCHGQVQRLQKEKDDITTRLQKNQSEMHRLDMDMMRLQQQIERRRSGLRDLEHALWAHREIAQTLGFLQECKAWHDKTEYMVRQMEALVHRQTLDLLQTDVRELQSMRDALHLQMRIIEHFDIWYDDQHHAHRLKACHALTTQTAPELTLLRDKKAENSKNADMVERLSRYVQSMGQRTRLLEQIMEHFACFKTWVIESKVIPSITEKVNFLLRHFCIQHRNIALTYNFVPQKGDSGQISWFIREGHRMTLPIEKASGFQRFVINLAMRIVLGKFGICGIKNKQLFIDEGFTSFDQDNLENVPHILSELLLPLFKSIIIVTHLESIQNHIPSYIPITRDGVRATSTISFGRPDCIPCGRKTGRPK